MGLFDSTDEDTWQYREYKADDSGSTVIAKRIGDIAKYLNDDEKVVHLLKAANIEQGTGEDNNSAATKLGEAATVAFTKNRVVMKVPHYLGDEQYTVRYERIQHVSYDIEGILGRRTFTIGTAGDTYRIGVHMAIDDQEVQEIVNWVDRKVAKATESSDTESQQSTKERLNELEDLLDSGLISDEEYENKRDDILDGI